MLDILCLTVDHCNTPPPELAGEYCHCTGFMSAPDREGLEVARRTALLINPFGFPPYVEIEEGVELDPDTPQIWVPSKQLSEAYACVPPALVIFLQAGCGTDGLSLKDALGTMARYAAMGYRGEVSLKRHCLI